MLCALRVFLCIITLPLILYITCIVVSYVFHNKSTNNQLVKNLNQFVSNKKNTNNVNFRNENKRKYIYYNHPKRHKFNISTIVILCILNYTPRPCLLRAKVDEVSVDSLASVMASRVGARR